MTINKEKSGIMFLEVYGNKNKIAKKYCHLKLDNYPIINNYKYLGVILDNNLNLNYNTKSIIQKINANKKLITT